MLAPMAEISHRALRELIHSFMEPALQLNVVYFSEMISAPGLLAGGPFEKYYIDNGPCPRQLVYQLVGAETDHLVKAAALLDEQECLGININMGCSAPAITRTGAGVRWMEDSDRAAGLIEQIRRVTRKQLSVKIRLGSNIRGNKERKSEAGEWWIDPLLRFCRSLEAAGLDLIILHPRLAAEKFKRKVRWVTVEVLRKELSIPVAGNGDIDSVEELACKAVAGPVMAGRLLVREPWAFAAVAKTGTLIVNREETGLHFLKLLAQYQPPEFHLSRARHFFRYYCDNVIWAEYLRNNISRETSLAGIERVWQEYFKEKLPMSSLTGHRLQVIG
ncbi:MAG: tRNA-dihydrouridine synthase family protein [Treponema sp.]|jgi:tRNA-dihydrouridine synthase|nr:tRNA-dihydrouridine synthase family protein [Treponema sp.]